MNVLIDTCIIIDALTAHVKAGIEKARERFGKIESLSVDTWGVDYVLLRGDEEVQPCYAYRDHRTEAVIPNVHDIAPFPYLPAPASNFSPSTPSISFMRTR